MCFAFTSCCLGLIKEAYKTCDKEEKDYGGEHEGYVRTHPFRNLETLTLVCLGSEILPAPAVSPRTEQNEAERTDGQENVTYDEVLKVHNSRVRAERSDKGEQIETEYAGQREREHQNSVNETSLLSRPAEHISRAGDNIFEHRKYG